MGVDPSADTTQSSNNISQVWMKTQNNQWRDVRTWRGSLWWGNNENRESEAGVERSWLLICSLLAGGDIRLWREGGVAWVSEWNSKLVFQRIITGRRTRWEQWVIQVQDSELQNEAGYWPWMPASRRRSCERVMWWLDEIAASYEIKKQEVTRPGYHHGDLVKNWCKCGTRAPPPKGRALTGKHWTLTWIITLTTSCLYFCLCVQSTAALERLRTPSR